MRVCLCRLIIAVVAGLTAAGGSNVGARTPPQPLAQGDWALYVRSEGAPGSYSDALYARQLGTKAERLMLRARPLAQLDYYPSPDGQRLLIVEWSNNEQASGY